MLLKLYFFHIFFTFLLWSIVKPIIKSGVVPHIVSIVINEDDTDILEEACWCILHLCTGKNKLVLYLIEHEILNALKSMISMYNKDIARNAIRSVANWWIQSNYIRDFIMEADFHEFIIGRLQIIFNNF